MLKALNQNNGEEIVILNSQWRDRISVLRKLDAADGLLCPGCRQPVRVRAGAVRRWHFAHKHLANCPFERESPLLLATRATLYEWLVAQFGETTAEVEVNIEGLPRHVDVCLKLPISSTPTFLVYWIFETRMPPDERERLRQGIAKHGGQPQWVFTAPMLHPVETDPDALNLDISSLKRREKVSQLYLTTTEREFMARTPYDEALSDRSISPGKTLHYLEPAPQTSAAQLTTYRNLHVVHPPQRYAGLQLCHTLSEVRVNPHTGGFVHPGEIERVEDYLALKARREAKQARILPSLSGKITPPSVSLATEPARDQRVEEAHAPSRTPFNRSGKCRVCGKQTEDWISFDGKTGACICRECAPRETKSTA